ncbi:MAG: nucleoside-diphosphate kinase [Dehalococcoidia bacterium]|nr:nucleoside-diphosphate kinase [Dehalococcoidia bacterium]
MERTLVLIKPDGIQRGLTGEIISRLERTGLKIIAMKMIQMDESLAKRHYSIHQGKPFFVGLIKYITSCPIVAVVLEGRKAVEVARKVMGSTDSAAAPAGTIRGDLGIDMGRNLVHGSDAPASAEKEIGLFFAPGELRNYSRDIDKWITESAG